MLTPIGPPTPGQYLGAGLAPFLRLGEVLQVWSNQTIVAGTTTSLAAKLEWNKQGFFYVPKVTYEIVFSGAPGTFEIDAQFAEIDTGNNYVASSTLINSVNANNVARWDLPTNFFPQFIRLFAKTFPNAVTANAWLYH